MRFFSSFFGKVAIGSIGVFCIGLLSILYFYYPSSDHHTENKNMLSLQPSVYPTIQLNATATSAPIKSSGTFYTPAIEKQQFEHEKKGKIKEQLMQNVLGASPAVSKQNSVRINSASPTPNFSEENIEKLFLAAQEESFYPEWSEHTKKISSRYTNHAQGLENTITHDTVIFSKDHAIAALQSLEDLNSSIEQDHIQQVMPMFSSAEQATQVVSSVAALEPNYVYVPFDTANDAKFSSQWELSYVFPSFPVNTSIQGSSASPVIVAVIDTGVDIFHEDLQAMLWKSDSCVDENGILLAAGCQIGGWDFVDHDNNPFPSDGYAHGTQVASMVGAHTNNMTGIASASGILTNNKNILIMPIRACCTKDGFFESLTIEKAIYFAVQNGAKVINMSFGGPTKSERMLQAIEYAQKNGVLVVAAAGNYASNNDIKPLYPANYDLENIITVGALDRFGNMAPFSNYGQTIDIMAPGAQVWSASLNNTYTQVNGTSFAAPMVAGLLAVYLL